MHACLSFTATVKAWAARLLISLLFVHLLSPADLPASQPDPDDAIFWSMSQNGEPFGFLLGTIHSEDPRVLDFPETFIEQLTSCQTFAMEMVPDLPTLARLTEYMHYPDQATLLNVLGSQRYERVMAALATYQVPADWKSRMKVWAIMMTLSVPRPETGFFMDLSLSMRAAGSGMQVVGLETLDQQLSFLEDMPIDYQLVLLDQALNDYQQVQQIHDEMLEIYLSGRLSPLNEMSEEQFEELDPVIRDYFMQKGLLDRNQRMLENLLPLLQEGTVFAAVGALHLGGPGGLLQLLRGQGYTLHALPLPFTAGSGDQRPVP